MTTSKAPRVLLTGGAGFLGQAILRELSRSAMSGESKGSDRTDRTGRPDELAVCTPEEIRVFDLEPVDVTGLRNAVSLVGDVCDYPSLLRACRDIDVVIHSAAMVDWGQASPGRLQDVNVGGTQNVIRACLEAAVPALVYTSSMDVVCGSKPVVDADESTPYPEPFANEYSRTKALAEQLVLDAHASPWASQAAPGLPGCRLATCALRPCGMFGEGDPYHVENVLRVVREGKLTMRPGNGKAAFQHVYVGNVAHAHLLAMQSLLDPDSPAGGQAYFVTDDTPAINFLDFMEPIVNALGYTLPPKNRKVPYALMLAIGAVMEGVAALCRPIRPFTPTLTRSSVRFVCHDHTFNGDKARRDLGYAPIYKESESLERTIRYFRDREARRL